MADGVAQERLGWVVINLSKAEKFLLEPYAEKYKVFEDDATEEMIAHARSIGWDDFFGFGISTKPGMATTHMCGEANIMILRVSINQKKERAGSNGSSP